MDLLGQAAMIHSSLAAYQRQVQPPQSSSAAARSQTDETPESAAQQLKLPPPPQQLSLKEPPPPQEKQGEETTEAQEQPQPPPEQPPFLGADDSEFIRQANAVERAKKQRKWMQNYTLLKNFYDIHHHCRVGRNYTVQGVRLGQWITNQRVAYKRLKEGTSARMTEERIRLLDAIGFEWKVRNRDMEWGDWFGLLKEYYVKHGNSRVPNRYVTEDGFKLGVWVMTQRAVYNKTRKDKRSQNLTEEKIRLLQSLEFEWDAKGAEWMDWFEALKAYYMTHGHTRVPATFVTESGKKLGVWTHNQRTLCKKTLLGKSSAMTQQRFDLLQTVGFVSQKELRDGIKFWSYAA